MASLRVRTAPRPHPARCPPCRPSLGESGRELGSLNRPGCVPSSRFPSPGRAPVQAPPPRAGPLGPSRNSLAQSRQARDLKVPRPRDLAQLLAVEARARRGASRGNTYFPSHGLCPASWLPPPLWRKQRRLWAPCVASCKTSSWVSRRGPLTRWLQVWHAALRGFCRGPTAGSGLSTSARREGCEGRGDCDWFSGCSAGKRERYSPNKLESCLPPSLKLPLHSASL